MSHAKRVSRTVCIAVFLFVACSRGAAPSSSQTRSTASEWKEVDQLIEQQRFEEALKRLAHIRTEAQAHGRNGDVTAALVKEVQLRIGLHGYETAVRFLREQPWPKDLLSQTTLGLFYAHALVTYLSAYSWEIGERERVDTQGPIDLKNWNREQVFAEAEKSLAAIWAQRAALGHEPVKALAAYVSPNNYPAHVRDTLRDAVSYFAVELFANSSMWSPAERNDLFRLDFPALVKGLMNGTSKAEVKLDDPRMHPLAKICAILDDLERWHRERGEREGALEARLERLRRLRAAFSEPGELVTLRQDLESRLFGYRNLGGWSMGMAELSSMWQAEGDLVRAHRVARDGQKAYPWSPGGQRCLHQVKEIEAPDYSLSAMAADAPNRRSIEVRHRNLGALTFRAWPVDLIGRIKSAHDYNLLPNSADVLKLLAQKAPPRAQWTVQLPSTPDFRSHRTFVTPPNVPPGMYVIAASVHPDFQDAGNRVRAVNLLVTDLVLTVTPDGSGQVSVRALSGSTGKPIEGAEIALYRYDWQKGHQRIEEMRTNENGEVGFGPRTGNGSHFIVGRHGSNLALDTNWLPLSRPADEGVVRSSLVYTDRSIYRPLQKVFWKVVAYHGHSQPADFKVSPAASLSVSLVDPNGQVVEERSVTTNSFGSAAGAFHVPAGRLLGAWQVRTSWNGQAQVHVEEYKRPTFEVKILDSAKALRLNRPIVMSGEATYYFGLPVTNGEVRWRVRREPVYPWWWACFHGELPATTSQVVASGETRLNHGKFAIGFTPYSDKRASQGVTYRYAVEADLTDEGGETRSAVRAFRLGTTAVEAQVTADGAFLRGGGSLTITRTDLDGVPRSGKGAWRLMVLEQPAEAKLPADEPDFEESEVPSEEQRKSFHTPGDRLRSRASPGYSPETTIARWKDAREQAHGEVTHDANGVAKMFLSSLPTGAYRLRYTTSDDFGEKFSTWRDVIVAAPQGQRTSLAVPLYLGVEKFSAEVGETARFLVVSGLGNQELFFDRFRAGKRVERRRIRSDQPSLIEMPIREEDRGGFSVMVTAVRDHQVMSLQALEFVPWRNKELGVSFSTFRDRLRPGAHETWRVTVKAGRRSVDEGVAEVLTYMYDRSLDLFSSHTPPSPMSLWPVRTGLPLLHSSVGESGAMWVLDNEFIRLPSLTLRIDRLRFFSDEGIGGIGRFLFSATPRAAMPMMLNREIDGAKFDEEARRIRSDNGSSPRGRNLRNRDGNSPAQFAGRATASLTAQSATSAPVPQLRSNFAETAFFIPQLLTDQSGSASLEFSVPDSVTSWNVWVHAITRDLRSGSAQKEARSVKELMVRPYLPRFFREGDRAVLNVVIDNTSDHPISGDLKLEIFDEGRSTLQDFGISDAERTFTAPAAGSTHVNFNITAPKRVGTYTFKVVARSTHFSDGE
jgi:5-hydroxyisourate hydrolase-like protein (transthyretin family)